MATVGTGKYTYELVEGWGRLPEGWVLGQTAIVTDSQDRVYLFNRSDHPLVVMDRDGNFLWQSRVANPNEAGQARMEESVLVPSAYSCTLLPSACSWVSQRLASGVPCSHWMCWPSLSFPPPPPATMTGRSLY